MRNIISLLFLFAVGCSMEAFAQDPGTGRPPMSPPIQPEFQIGINKLLFQNILIKPLDKGHRFDFFNITYFDSHFNEEDKPFNEGLIQSYVAYNFVKGVGIGVGGTYNSFTGVSPNLVGQFVNAGRSHLIVFFVAAHLKSTPSYEAFTQIQFRPALSENIRLFTQLMALTNWTRLEVHSRSFQQFRLGLDVKNYQFGFGADFDQYGPIRQSKTNLGLFIRTEIFN
ncbi:hypothetical protein SAMN00777080_3478 [Aquiflexum balticum DSM 16537]|uniref:Uncharacterized protein n=1 Tax=Aquiflexum balticum DSM 16537 TaxID=758820 RepID=A0A1W2H864_9BACT|nr:hypothetical protein [Aquiflexum balticum]SMD44842.1 hypothetical protein SAMN00777080_3478 [Aquiflexum balticum DSM 16537]